MRSKFIKQLKSGSQERKRMNKKKIKEWNEINYVDVGVGMVMVMVMVVVVVVDVCR